MILAALVVGVTASGAVSCRRGPPNPNAGEPATTAVAADTARGVVSQHGAEPLTVLLLGPTDGGEQLVLKGALSPLLQRVVGLDIVVRGTLTSERSALASPRGNVVFVVREFEVRGAQGTAAVDGLVGRRGAVFSLRLQNGTTRTVAAMPVALQSKLGARVFLVGPLDRPPVSYGVIAEANRKSVR